MTPADRLTARLDELASSLHRAGVPAAEASRLLELAALATMKAVELELRAAARNAPPQGPPAARAGEVRSPPLRAAA